MNGNACITDKHTALANDDVSEISPTYMTHCGQLQQMPASNDDANLESPFPYYVYNENDQSCPIGNCETYSPDITLCEKSPVPLYSGRCLKFISWNINGLTEEKLSDYILCIFFKKFDIIVLTETWACTDLECFSFLQFSKKLWMVDLVSTKESVDTPVWVTGENSVIDYILGSPELFDAIYVFQIGNKFQSLIIYQWCLRWFVVSKQTGGTGKSRDLGKTMET